MPEISICVPAYENGEGIRRLLRSLKAQTCQDYEVIITDDSGSDAVEKAVEEFCRDRNTKSDRIGQNGAGQAFASTQEDACRIRYIKNKEHKGAVANWNMAISMAKGRFVQLLHHDDWLSSGDSLSKMAAMLREDPDCAMAFCGSVQVPLTEENKEKLDRDAARILQAAALPGAYTRCMPKVQQERLARDWRALFLENSVGAPSAVMVRRESLEQAQIRYDESLTWFVDSDYYMQILSRYPRFAMTEEPLIAIGMSDAQLTERCIHNEELVSRESICLYRKFHLEKADSCYEDRLLQILAENHIKSEQLPDDLHLSPEKWKKARKAQREKEKDQRYDTACYLAGHVQDLAEKKLTESAPGRLFGRLRQKMEKPSQWIYWLAITIELLIVVIDKSALLNPFEGRLFQLTFLFFVIRILCTDYSRRERWYLAAFCVLGFLSWRISGRNEILRMTALVAASRGMPVRKVMKYAFWFTTAGCLALTALSLTGVMGVVSLTQDFGRGLETRYCLGLGHPNAMHCMVLMLTILGLYLYGEKVKPVFYGLLLAADLGLYMLTRSNTGFAMTAAAILGFFVLNLAEKRNGKRAARSREYPENAAEKEQQGADGKQEKQTTGRKAGKRPDSAQLLCIICTAALAVMLLLSVLAAVWGYEIPFMAKADRLLNGRIISLWDATFHDGTLSTWFWFSPRENDNFFDMGYVRLLYWYGVIPGAIMLGVLFALIRAAGKQKDRQALWMILLCCIYTLVEAHLVSEYLLRNYLLLLIAMYSPIIFGSATQCSRTDQ